jgi:hypothetical protein
MSGTVIARRIVATPVRSASEVWAVVVDLLAPAADGAARGELEAVAGIASVLISDEALRDSPAVIWGNGPRVRFYCLYDDEAISGDARNENGLPCTPADGDWHLSLPCPADDLAWVQNALRQKSQRITARDMDVAAPEESDAASEDLPKSMTVNEEVFLRS